MSKDSINFNNIYYTVNGLKLNIDNIDNFENTTKSVKKNTPKKNSNKTSSKSVKKNSPSVKKNPPPVKKNSPKIKPNVNLLANNLHVDKQLCVGKSCLDQSHLDDLISPKVIFYSACDYKGTAVSAGIGSFDISKIKLESNKINSMKIPQGVRVKLF